jgi:hypothetical protein
MCEIDIYIAKAIDYTAKNDMSVERFFSILFTQLNKSVNLSWDIRSFIYCKNMGNIKSHDEIIHRYFHGVYIEYWVCDDIND